MAAYPQDWPAYNAAQTNEKDKFMVLLRDLCSGLPEPEQKRGRPRLSLRDAVFTAVLKVYTTASARRSMSDLREAHQRGFISKLPCHNSVLNALESADLTPIFRELIVESSKPMKAVDKDATDTKQLPALAASTARHFAVAEVSADKGYGSVKNADTIAALGATPFIAFKSNSSGRAGHGVGRAGHGAWEKMFGYFLYRRDEFLMHYHKRSNVESTFSMIKRKFGDSLRSKTGTAQVNETLAKVLCHNLVVLIHEMYELGIDPIFWAQSSVAQEVVR